MEDILHDLLSTEPEVSQLCVFGLDGVVQEFFRPQWHLRILELFLSGSQRRNALPVNLTFGFQSRQYLETYALNPKPPNLKMGHDCTAQIKVKASQGCLPSVFQFLALSPTSTPLNS